MKAGGCIGAQLEGLSRMISYNLQCGGDIKSIVEHLKGIRCANQTFCDGNEYLSCSDAIAQILGEYWDMSDRVK